jgi:hypothetical protein
MCFSPLRRKTSELEGEEYTSRIVSRIDRLDPPLVSSRFTRLCTHLGKPESLLIGSLKSSPAVDGATAAQTLGQCNKSLVWTAVPFECGHVCHLVQIKTQVNEAKQSCGWNEPTSIFFSF